MGDINLRELQLEELKILKEVTNILEINNLSYFAMFGTLIGCVRHNGFIPWDDDVDIAMPRSDYEKFLQLAEQILPSNLKVLHYSKNVFVPNKILRIENINTCMIPLDIEGNLRKEVAHGVQIDIFPIDGIYANEKKAKKTIKKVRRMMSIDTLFREKYYLGMSLKHRMLHFFIQPLSLILGKCFFIKKYNRLLSRIDRKKECFISNAGMDFCKPFICPDVFDSFEYAKFENIQLRIPKNYDLFLKSCYGDYMKFPPIEEQIPLHTDYFYDFSRGYNEF